MPLRPPPPSRRPALNRLVGKEGGDSLLLHIILHTRPRPHIPVLHGQGICPGAFRAIAVFVSRLALVRPSRDFALINGFTLKLLVQAGEGRAVRPRVPQAAARLAPRGRREVNGNEHVRAQREHQPANCDAPVARRRSRPAAPRRGMTPRARSFGCRSARWPATRSSSRERDLVVVRRAPHCENDADANAAGCAPNRVVRAVAVEPLTASVGAWNLEIQPNRRPATIRGVSDRPPAW